MVLLLLVHHHYLSLSLSALGLSFPGSWPLSTELAWFLLINSINATRFILH